MAILRAFSCDPDTFTDLWYSVLGDQTCTHGHPEEEGARACLRSRVGTPQPGAPTRSVCVVHGTNGCDT